MITGSFHSLHFKGVSHALFEFPVLNKPPSIEYSSIVLERILWNRRIDCRKHQQRWFVKLQLLNWAQVFWELISVPNCTFSIVNFNKAEFGTCTNSQNCKLNIAGEILIEHCQMNVNSFIVNVWAINFSPAHRKLKLLNLSRIFFLKHMLVPDRSAARHNVITLKCLTSLRQLSEGFPATGQPYPQTPKENYCQKEIEMENFTSNKVCCWLGQMKLNDCLFQRSW